MILFESLTYWKPIQSGLHSPSDSEVVSRLASAGPRVLPERYRLTEPLSPNQAARREAVAIDRDALQLPEDTPILVECAGGLLVPINDTTLQIDLISDWALPVLIVARSSLGTINHSLLSIEALRSRSIEIAGFITVGPEWQDNVNDIVKFGEVVHMGHLPWLEPLSSTTLRVATDQSIDASSFKKYFSRS